MKYCLNCNCEIERNKFCSRSCAVTYNNKLRNKKKKNCLNCGEITTNRKFCNHNCEKTFNWNEIKKKINSGDTTLYYFTYKKFLIEKNGEKCMDCGWCEINKISNRIPLELHHKDHNPDNNKIENLELLCPNCHSLKDNWLEMRENGKDSKRRKVRKENYNNR